MFPDLATVQQHRVVDAILACLGTKSSGKPISAEVQRLAFVQPSA